MTRKILSLTKREASLVSLLDKEVRGFGALSNEVEGLPDKGTSLIRCLGTLFGLLCVAGIDTLPLTAELLSGVPISPPTVSSPESWFPIATKFNAYLLLLSQEI